MQTKTRARLFFSIVRPCTSQHALTYTYITNHRRMWANTEVPGVIYLPTYLGLSLSLSAMYTHTCILFIALIYSAYNGGQSKNYISHIIYNSAPKKSGAR